MPSFCRRGRNLSVDIMHDILEGICEYDLGLILFDFIKIKNLFTLKYANILIKGFDYGHNKNKSQKILESQLLKKK